MKQLIPLLICFPLALWAAGPDQAGTDFFEKNIRPLLTEKCYDCHSGSPTTSKGGLLLDTSAGVRAGGDDGAVIVPGKPEASMMMRALGYQDESLQMPPKSAGGRLTDAQIDLVRQWIAKGAPDPRDGTAHRLSGLTPEARAHWSFQPVVKPALPEVRARAWCLTPVDFFVLAKLEANGLRPSPPADPEALLRRMYYDMLGLPPTLEEINAFSHDYEMALRTEDYAIAEGKVPYGEGAKGFYPARRLVLEKWIDQLLASPHYGERWGRHWLDTARYSDTAGTNNQNPKNRFEGPRYEYAWTYRDYVIDALNHDKPYNQFVVEQLAADKLPDLKPQDERLAALGFLTVGKHFDNADDLIDERIDTTAKAFLGLTVSCARCHDHKFDPIPTADYYSWHGIFNSIEEPVDRPQLKLDAPAAVKADYQKRLADLDAANRVVYYDEAATLYADMLAEPRLVEHGYIVAFGGQSTQAFAARKKYGLDEEKNNATAVISNANNHPVFGPYNVLARLFHDKPSDFAALAPAALKAALARPKIKTNPIIARELARLTPKTLDDVGIAYAQIFARGKKDFTAYLAARRESRPLAVAPARPPDDATLEIFNALWPIADARDLATPEQQETCFSKLQMPNQMTNLFVFDKINELRLTHPGAPGCAMVVTDLPTPKNSPVLIRGDPAKRGPVEPRHFLTLLTQGNPAPFADGSGRFELAKLIASPDNPLTARVEVNRVWQGHFGEGFVRTPDDLGNMSEPPSNQELLDYLSVWFVENGWSLKKLHKLILLSNAYQQSSNPALNPLVAEGKVMTTDPRVLDPDNRLLWRAPVRRLDFESIRDSLILLTGKMDPTLGGKPVNITDEPYSYRRSIYGYIDRAQLSDLLTQFDFPPPDNANSRRISTIVPQQALFFLNGPLTVDVARHLIARPEVGPNLLDTDRLAAIYRILFQRKPTATETKLAQDFLRQAALLVPKPDPDAPRPAPKKVAAATVSDSTMMMSMVANGKNGAVKNTGAAVARTPLTPWELLAQALLFSNEFVYVN